MTGASTMPDEQPRRVIIEKSSTVRRRYQRSNKRFQFTAEQLARIERDQERERRAKQLREKEKKRVANKKKKAEQDARAREERKRTGLPDPNAPKVPSSQPLLSMFLKKPAPAEKPEPERHDRPDPTTTETEENGDGGDTEADSAAGDTEVDSDAFDDLGEEIEDEMFDLQDADILKYSSFRPASIDASRETRSAVQDDHDDDGDEFSDCSAFDDEDIMKEADAVAATTTAPAETKQATVQAPALLQPPTDQPKTWPTPIASFGDSFRDETADYLEQVSFSELVQLDPRVR